ncbi:MAG: preprotein translocase subunit SecY [Planctomycetes bacterium]|nr:preprotein translocase subunit SecY [Planctomycetota bacterium]
MVGAGIVFGVAAVVALLYFGFLAAVGIGLLFGLVAFLLLGNSKLVAVFTIPELRQKIFITLLFLTIYRIGFFIPLPFVNQDRISESLGQRSGALAQILGFVSLFSGGNLSNAAIFALGIMPYISASIILQLLTAVYPPLEKLKKEGEAGQKKINEYTRYLTVLICLIQAFFLVQSFMRPEAAGGQGWAKAGYGAWVWPTMIITLTAGTIFLMWCGEQIDEYGVGNGISLIIMAGIVARFPAAIGNLLFDNGVFRGSLLTLGGTGSEISFEKVVVLMALFVFVVIAVVAITKGQRRIPTQSAKHVRGRRVYGGTRQYLPLRVNQAGVMPVIFASSLLMLPMFLFMGLASATNWGWARTFSDLFQKQGYWYNVFYIGLIYFFCYFWTAIQFNPKELANNLKDNGSFIPGYRPGRRTAEYLEKVLMRITYVGAAFLAVIAVIPSIIQGALEIDYLLASFYGGTGLLIVVSVALDLVQKINSHLVMRNYPGLTED